MIFRIYFGVHIQPKIFLFSIDIKVFRMDVDEMMQKLIRRIINAIGISFFLLDYHGQYPTP
jgi:hypothetical protein